MSTGAAVPHHHTLDLLYQLVITNKQNDIKATHVMCSTAIIFVTYVIL